MGSQAHASVHSNGGRGAERPRGPHSRRSRPSNLILARPAVQATVTTLGVACALLVLVPAAWAAVWTASPGAKVFPSTHPGAQLAVTVRAAGGEYRGLIIGLRAGVQRHVSVTWSADSDPLLVQNAILDQVAFVRISHPTTGTGARAGLYPDPLLPRRFGQTLTAPAKSSSLYVLFHVPYGTPGGVYAGTLHVVNGTEQVDVPVQLRVWSFGWQRLSVRTGFMVTSQNITGDPLDTYSMLEEHGVTPMAPGAYPRAAANGDIKAALYEDKLRPYLASDGLDMVTVRLPWSSLWPGYSWKFSSADSRLLNYLTQVCRVYRDNGWDGKAFGYPVDEPTSTSAERQAERMARTLHKASARVGYRAKYFLTDDPRPTSLQAMLPANRFLWDDVDIWCVRYYYFFGRVPILKQLQAKGRQVWWYPYFNTSVSKLPNFVIDKPLADQRVWGWLMYQWNVDGMLYWGVNRWSAPGGGSRDPYRNPLSFRYADGRVANGEASLIYPGYYPRYGLNDRLAPPVSSLRLESLREGFEDREYLLLANKLFGASYVRSVVKSVTWYPYRVRYGHVFEFPKYKTTPSTYNAARKKLAERIEQTVTTP